jgi:uncharacterized protein
MPRPGYVIDSVACAREGARIDGEIEIASLPRLIEVLDKPQGMLGFSGRGEVAPNGELFLDLEVGGVLGLRCQRCLEPMDFAVSLAHRFRLIEAGQPWPDDELADDGFDAIAAERQLDLVALVEQEVLLALPLAPRHADCTMPPRHTEDKDQPSPFAALAALKRGR